MTNPAISAHSLNQKLLLPGITLGPPIGQGAESVVYRANYRDQECAVKIHYDSAPGKELESRRRLRREAAFMARLKHVGLASVIEAGEANGKSYLVMEYVDGHSLAEILHHGALDEIVIVSLAKVLASALAEVHQYGLVHRDIKPQNILINQEGQPKLIDFGFAKQSVSEGVVEAASEEVVGTLLYSAPEQIGMLKRPVDGRADLYALGVVLFECATGAPPFQTRNVNELLHQHAAVIPPNVREINQKISPGFAAVIEKLLSKDPDERYQTGQGLVYDLEQLESLNAKIAIREKLALGLKDEPELIREIPLVGRDQEVASLQKAWKNTLSGTGSVLLVEGQPGTGKSRLVRELLDEVRKHDSLIISGKCSLSNPLPFAPLRKGVDSYLRRVKRLPTIEREKAEENIRAAAKKYASLLKRFSPLLSKIIGEEVASSEREEAQDVFYTAIAEFLVSIGKPYSGTVLFIDDVQWLDDASSRVLQRIAVLLQENSNLLLAATARNDTNSLGGLRRFIGDMGESLTNRITTKPLQGDHIKQLVLSHLGGGDIEESFITQIASRTNGNPFSIGEYIRSMLDAGLLRPTWGAWLVDQEGLEQLQLSDNVIQLVVKRIDKLDESTKDVLGAAALLGSRFEIGLLPAICGVEAGLMHAAIAQGLQARLIERTETNDYAFVHDRVQEALLSRLSPAQTQTLHQIIAEVLNDSDGEGIEHTLSLARHYSLGTIQKNPQKVYETNLEAGLTAMEEYAHQEAFAFLQQARNAAEIGQIPTNLLYHQTLGEVCARTSRLDDAISNFNLALQHTSDGLRKASIRARIALVHQTNLDPGKAWEETVKGLADAGSPWPRFGIVAFFAASFYWFLGLAIRWTGIGYGTAKGKARERYQVLARLYEISAYIAYLSADDIFFTQVCIRPLYIANRLGPSIELSKIYSNYAALLGVLKLKGLYEFYAQKANQVAEQLGDGGTLGRTNLFYGYAAHFAGHVRTAEHLHLRTVNQFGSWMDPNDYLNSCMDLSAMLQLRGYFKESLEWGEKGFERLRAASDSGDADMHVYQSYIGAALAAINQPREAIERIQKSFQVIEGRFGQKYMLGCALFNKTLYHYFQEDSLSDVQETGEQYHALKMAPYRAFYHLKFFHVYYSYNLFSQVLRSSPEERASRHKLFQSALKNLMLSANVPLLKCHYLILRAADFWFRDQKEKSLKLLNQATTLSQEVDSPWATCEIAQMRARILIKEGNESAGSREVLLAATLASRHGWAKFSQKLQKEFGSIAIVSSSAANSSVAMSMTGLSSMASSSKSSHLSKSSISSVKSRQISSRPSGKSSNKHMLSASPTTGSRVPSVLHLQRKLDAMLQISAASGSVLDPDEQARNALDEIVRILGAERALLFLTEVDTERLLLKAGRDAEGNDIEDLEKYSSSAIEKVVSTRKPIVFSSNEEEEISVAESVLAHNLRSIMVVPLLRQDRLVGLVYLDNRLAKGVFTNDDVEILLGIANHIAIALETAQLAQVKLERASLEKDIAVTSTIQSLFLPKQNSVETSDYALSAFYRPASQSGGDWWWHEKQPNGKVLVLLGDVTGHGVGSAMVAVAVANSYRTLQQIRANELPSMFLRKLNQNFQEINGGIYNMTLSVLEFDLERNVFRWWSAGSPPLLVLRKDGRVEALSLKGTLLGTNPFEPGAKQYSLQPGERILAFSDGLIEAPTKNGRMFGLRKLHNVFAKTKTQNLETSCQTIIQSLDSRRDLEKEQEDDITFLVFEHR